MPLVRIDAPDTASADACATSLEEGDILFFPVTPFDLPDPDQEFLRSISGLGAARHKNVAYKPALDKVTGYESADAERLRAVFRLYSERVIDFVRKLLPRYATSWKIDYASFRSEEEEGRDLPWKKRNDLLHVDAFPSRPTNGDLILRIFTNLNVSKPRAWLTGEPFEVVATQYADDAGLRRIAAESQSAAGGVKRALTRAVGPLLRVPDRAPYDRFMLGFHDYLKQNEEYQKNCAKYRYDFPPGSTWMVFTDVVPHAVLSGQYALEQTLIISRDSLVMREKAQASILERLSAARLTYAES
jgi:hypothetical protein